MFCTSWNAEKEVSPKDHQVVTSQVWGDLRDPVLLSARRMTDRSVQSASMGSAYARPERSGLVAKAIFGVDRLFRKWRGVFEYTSDLECLFRAEVIQLDDDIVLADGSTFPARKRIAKIHLWNEQVPRFPAEGATLLWARRMYRGLDVSLREMAVFLGAQEFQDVVGVRAEMTLGTAEQTDQLLRMCARFGFCPVSNLKSPSVWTRLHRLTVNVYIALLVLARNPQGLRLDSFRRSRADIFLPRSVLEQRYQSNSRQVA